VKFRLDVFIFFPVFYSSVSPVKLKCDFQVSPLILYEKYSPHLNLSGTNFLPVFVSRLRCFKPLLDACWRTNVVFSNMLLAHHAKTLLVDFYASSSVALNNTSTLFGGTHKIIQ
jgi:hypothetical protein